jgi:ribonuclease P protein component
MFSFSRVNRLRKSREFRSTMDSGKKIVSPNLVVLGKRTTSSEGRLGLVVSGKVGNAVVRNRIKRHLRECYRQLKHRFPGIDVVVIARHNTAKTSGQALCKALESNLETLASKLPKPLTAQLESN